MKIKKIKNLVGKHDNWRKNNCINLIASENQSLKLANDLYLNDMMHRYAEGEPFDRYYQGTEYLDKLDVLVNGIFQDLFGVDYVEMRPLSGTMANMAVFKAFKDSGVYFDSKISQGSHVSHTRFGSAGLFGLEERNLPFDYDRFQIDPVESAKRINEEKPDFVILGKSLFPFPEPLEELRENLEVDTKIIYDAAHVLGLIAGNKFQSPFEEGADVMTASTHKTFPGPQGGIVFSKKKEDHEKIKKAIFPGLVCNWHSHRLGHLGVTAVGMKKFGEEYAEQTVNNAKTIAEKMSELGFDVLSRDGVFTESHTIAVDVSDHGGGKKVAKMLEDQNIILNKNTIPTDSSKKDPKDPDGIRLGTQEMTFLGMKEGEMKEIAELIHDAVVDKKDVKEKVKSMKKRYNEPAYSV